MDEVTPAELVNELEVIKQDELLDQLVPRRRAFVKEYLKDLNGTKAAVRAGYSAKTANEIAAFLLANVSVAAAVEQALRQREEALDITQAKVLSEMHALATSSVDHYVVSDEGQVVLAPGAPANAMGAIQSIKKRTTVRTIMRGDDELETIKTYDVELKLWDKPTPLKLIGKHVSLFADRVEHTGKDGGPIETVTKVERVIVDPVVDSVKVIE